MDFFVKLFGWVLGALFIVMAVAVAFALSFGLAWVAVWAVCYVLTLAGLAVVFSWKLVLAVWVIYIIWTIFFGK